jgi:hypothetical protein
MTEYELRQIRVRCVEVTLAACMRADIQRDDGLVFAEKVFEFVMKTNTDEKKKTPSK